MKAVTYKKYGSPEVLQLSEVEKPIPKDDEVLIKVHAVSINPLDWHIMRGAPFFARFSVGLFKPKFNVLGADVAGKVEGTGKDVTEFETGDEVFGDAFSSGLGGLAEYVCVSEKTLVQKPGHISYEDAAAVPVAGITALTALRDIANVLEGQKVLINGSSGGVGTFAIQIAKVLGARTVGVCSTRNVDLVRSIGADEVIDYTKEDIAKNNDQYDAIIDNVGNLTVSVLKSLLTPSGIAAIVGFTRISLMMKVALLGGKRIQMVNVNTTKEDLNFIKELLESNKIRSVIDRTCRLEETPAAMAYLEKGHARGKVVIVL